jgi:hypothetical protein
VSADERRRDVRDESGQDVPHAGEPRGRRTNSGASAADSE